jgi:uncharacterized protein YciU (UPF0263 family)
MPFFCNLNVNDQNTDPFIFGDTFFYTICKKAQLKNLKPGDVILFGSEFGKRGFEKFYLDTLFVVDKELSITNDSQLFNRIFIESTLNRLGLSSNSDNPTKIHSGVKFSLKQLQFYSFTPSKIASAGSFGRPIIDTLKYGLQKPGARTGAKSRQINNDENIQAIWNNIARDVIGQDFVLGTHFNELTTFNALPC